jgi:hypothetical protein
MEGTNVDTEKTKTEKRKQGKMKTSDLFCGYCSGSQTNEDWIQCME